MRFHLVLACCLLLSPAARAELILATLPPEATPVALPDLATSLRSPSFTVADPVAGPLVFYGDVPLVSSTTGRLSTEIPTNWNGFMLTSAAGVAGVSFAVSGGDLSVDVNRTKRLIDDRRSGTRTSEVSILATAGDTIRSLDLSASQLSFLTDFRVLVNQPTQQSAPEPATLVPAGIGVLMLLGLGWVRWRSHR